MKELTEKLANVQTNLKAKKSSYNSFGKYHFRCQRCRAPGFIKWSNS